MCVRRLCTRLQVCDINYENCFCCDPKSDSYCTVVENEVYHLPLHFWNYIEDIEKNVQCRFGCLLKCAPPAPKELDMLIACAPCQPYSKLARSKKLPEEHPLHYTIFGEEGSVCSFSAKYLPHLVVSENVLGILEKKGRGLYRDHRPADKFVERMMSIVCDKGEKWFIDVECVEADSFCFVPQGRPRLSFLVVMVLH